MIPSTYELARRFVAMDGHFGCIAMREGGGSIWEVSTFMKRIRSGVGREGATAVYMRC